MLSRRRGLRLLPVRSIFLRVSALRRCSCGLRFLEAALDSKASLINGDAEVVATMVAAMVRRRLRAFPHHPAAPNECLKA